MKTVDGWKLKARAWLQTLELIDEPMLTQFERSLRAELKDLLKHAEEEKLGRYRVKVERHSFVDIRAENWEAAKDRVEKGIAKDQDLIVKQIEAEADEWFVDCVESL